MRGWMVTTMVLGLVVLGLALLVVAINSVIGRIRPLRRAVRRLSWRADEAKQLQAKALALEEKLADFQRQAQATAAKAERSQARRQVRRRLD